MVVHAYNTSTWEVEVGGSQIVGQPGLHKETLSQKKIVPQRAIPHNLPYLSTARDNMKERPGEEAVWL
jgi:hypothetical protein